MKNVLITGNGSSLAAHVCQRLLRQYRAVIAASNIPGIAHAKGVDIVALSQEKTLEQVFQTYTFHSMIFLGTRGEQQSRIAGEADLLSSALALAKRHGVLRVLYVTSGELSRPFDAASERGVLMQAMEQLCSTYRHQGLEVTILRLPCIFGPGEEDTLTGRMLHAAAKGETVVLPFARDAQVDFISAAEVAQLIYRLVEKDAQTEALLSVRGAEALSVRELTALLGLLGASVSQGAGSGGHPPMESSVALRNYGFAPSERLSVSLDSLYAAVKKAVQKQEAGKGRIRGFFSRYPAVIKGTSLTLGYAAMEALQMLQNAGSIPAADLRLLYVVLISAAHGLQTGLFAVVLASFSIARGYGAQGMDLWSLLLDIKSWMPFAVLIFTGSFTGYARDRGRREASRAREEARTLEKRCAFLQDLYKQSLLDKDAQPDTPADSQERLEQQLSQLRQGQERLEQEWLTLLKREQARWEDAKPQEGKTGDAPKQEKQQAPEMTRAEKEQQELKVELERLRIARQSALQEMMERPDPAASGRQQDSQEENASKRYRSAPVRPPILLDGVKAPADEVDLDFDTLPAQLEIDDLPDDDYRHDKVIISSRAQAPAQKLEKNAQPEQGGTDTAESPFGKLSPSERRQMLEAMQVRAKTNLGGKPKRRR